MDLLCLLSLLNSAEQPAPPAVAGRLLEKDADKAQDNVDDEEACLVPPDAWGQGQSLYQSPADLHADHFPVISRQIILLQKDCRGASGDPDCGTCPDRRLQCAA